MTNEAMGADSTGVNRLRPAIWRGAALLLLLPLVAMQFTREVAWDATDFAVFGTMLTVACGAYEIATRVTDDRKSRAIAGLAIVTAFLLVWVELAVGIFED